MPREKAGERQRGIMAPVETWEALDALAAKNGRSAAAELLHALERHMKQPPTVTVHTPDLDGVNVAKPAGDPPKRRGRKPKAK